MLKTLKQTSLVMQRETDVELAYVEQHISKPKIEQEIFLGSNYQIIPFQFLKYVNSNFFSRKIYFYVKHRL